MITPNYFKRNTISVYNPDGTLLCEADEYTLYDLMFQIALENAEGYTYEWEGNKGTISLDGELSNWFPGMFDLTQLLFSKLLNARHYKKVVYCEKYKKMLK